MPCQWVAIPGGGYAHVRTAPAKRKRCPFCTHGWVEKLCDFVVGPGDKTCDAGMCARCASPISRDVDFCPKHRGQIPTPGALPL